MEFNQTFKAPSIPKLSKRTISSPFGEKSALATPKLKKTSFSFIRGIKSVPSVIFQKPEGEKEGDKQGLTKVLSDTNKIFGEIRDQLALDFATRIADAKKALSKIKQDNYKKRRGLKEGLISGAKKIGSGIMGQVNQILAPTKSIFQKIIEFFQIILTGIILNTAFKWLQKKENREKLVKIFKFVADHWKELLILFGTFKLLGLLFKIISVAKKLKTLIDLFRGKLPGGGAGPPNICNALLNCFGNPAVVTNLASWLLKNAIFLKGIQAVTGGGKPPVVTPPVGGTPPVRTPPVGGTPPVRTPTNPLGLPDWANATAWTLAGAGTIAATVAAAPVVLPLLAGGGLSASKIALILAAGGLTGIGLASSPGLAKPNTQKKAEGGTIEKPKKKCTSCSMGFSAGGSIGGRGKPKADDQQIWASTGEYITRTAMANLWRPLLIDINEAGGKLFDQFRQGVIKLTDLVGKMNNNSKVFRDITEEFNNYLKRETQKKKLKDATGGGEGQSRGMKNLGTDVMPKVDSSQDAIRLNKENFMGGLLGKSGIQENIPTKLHRDGSIRQDINFTVNSKVKPISTITPTSTGSSKPVIVPMTLPPITGKMPEIPTPTATSSEVPDISSVNMANPYMQNAKAYGIFVV